MRREAVAALDLAAGAAAADVGCGPGDGLGLLADAVGPPGTVLGIDYSGGMARRAADSARASPTVSVIRADAGAPPASAEPSTAP
jgi:ubiquinone/menaquinone biosynthesis C-methylase UbiE